MSVLLSASALSLAPANAFEEAPAGFYRHTDRLDGYTFAYPDTWIVVTTSGNDVFYRNSRVADENVFVDISSPSSSKYSSVQDLGTPDKAANRLQKQFLTELMSTRLGVKREIEPVFSQARTGVPKPSSLLCDVRTSSPIHTQIHPSAEEFFYVQTRMHYAGQCTCR